ncbi:actin cytoskeleton-regulatory complex protein PAN1 [Yarrowia lipolytica]|nr:actin cytoskeleton-regulatory complex protein PAN1 [Yarrowia lipolytica]
MYGYQGTGGQQPLGAQPTGFGFGNTPVQQQQQPMQPMQQSQPTGYQAPGGFQNYQPTGFAQQQQQQQPQQTGFQSMQPPMQQTGFQSQPNVSMYQGGGGQGYQSAPMLHQQTMQTGYQPQQQQPGFTGFQPQQQQQQQQTGFTGFQQQPQQQQPGFTGFQSQPTGYNANASAPAATPAAPLQQQKTGNARDPFAPTLPARPPLTSQPTGGGNKSVVDGVYIPNVRLSFLTADDQRNFENLFRQALPKGEQALSGDKARDILFRSGLPPITLSAIWNLADTTRSGALLFPEFAVAMYLCGQAVKGQTVPNNLSENIKNEVSSMVDIISFNIPDAGSRPSSSGQSVPQSQPQQQQQQSSASMLAGLNLGQPTGYQQQQATGYQPMQQQSTGYPMQAMQPQITGGMPLQQQRTGPMQPLQQQSTGYAPLQSQLTGGAPLQSQLTGGAPLQSQLTGGAPLQSQLTGGAPLQQQSTGYAPLQQQSTGYAPLQQQSTGYMPQQQTGMQPQSTGYGSMQPLTAMPTGKPGQWGFINTPSQGLPGIETMQQRLMPQATGAPVQQLPPMQLQQSATVNWAIAKEEKQIYDGIFMAWDKKRAGAIDGDTAIKIFTQSGLNRADLEAIWTLSDPSNKGRLDRDEFAVAMHLIYRHLNGYPIPSRLPPELVPPSSKNFSDSVNQVKSYLKAGGGRTGGSKLKSRSFTGDSTIKKDATVFKNDDSDFGYTSRNRRGGSSSTASSNGSSGNDISLSGKGSSISELKKLIREKQILLDAIDAEDSDMSRDSNLERRDQEAVADLKRRIQNVQRDIDVAPHSAISTDVGASADAKRNLMRKLDHLGDRLPQLASNVRRIEDKIANAKMELFRLKNPTSLVGTGPGGAITEADRIKARSKAKLQARMAALTGKGTATGADASEEEDYEHRLLTHTSEVERSKAQNYEMIHDIEDSVKSLQRDLSSKLRETQEEVSEDRQRRRWEEAVGVEDDVRQFIYSLRSTRSSRPAPATASSSAPATGSPATAAPISATSTGASTPSAPAAGVDRKAQLKAEAERKMNERLAALGIKRKEKAQAHGFAPPDAKPAEASPAASPAVASPAVASPAVASPAATPAVSSPAPVSRGVPAPAAATPATDPATTPAVPVSAPADDSDSDDEEYEKLMAQKREQEERFKKQQEADKKKEEEKKQKKAAKEERMRKLREEMEANEAREKAWKESQSKEAEADEAEGDVGAAALAAFSNKATAPSTTSTAVAATPPVATSTPSPAAPTVPAADDNNPFHRLNNGGDAAAAAPAAGGEDNNPFLRPGTNQPIAAPSPASFSEAPKEAPKPVDPVKISNQRANQRAAKNDDDDWGMSSDEDDDQDYHRGNAAELASQLFRTMAPPIQRQPTGGAPITATPTGSAPAAPPAAPPVAPAAVEVAVAASEATPGPESAPPAPPMPEINIPPATEAPSAPAATEAPPAPPSAPTTIETTHLPPPVDTHNDMSSSEFDFETPEGSPTQQTFAEAAPPVAAPPPPPPTAAAAAPTGIPPPPPSAPGFGAPEAPSGIPPPPPPAPGFGAPPPPPGPAPSFDAPGGAPPPPPPGPPPPMFGAPAPPSMTGPSAGDLPERPPAATGGITALLGEITGGKTLRRVDDKDKKISSNPSAGAVLN